MKRALSLSLLAWLLPYAPLLAAHFAFGEPLGISLIFFSTGAALEFMLSLQLLRLKEQGVLTRRRHYQAEYLTRTVIGLPLTVYFTIAAPFGFTALLRLLPTLAILGERRLSLCFWHLFFYVLGLFAFSSMQSMGLPKGSHAIIALAAVLIGLFLIDRLVRERAWRLDALKEAHGAHRLRRALSDRESRETALLSALLPDFQRELYREQKSLLSESGLYLAVGLVFPGLHESLVSFQKSVDYPSEQEGQRDFQLERDRLLEFMKQELRPLGLVPGIASDFWFLGRFIRPVRSDTEDLASLARDFGSERKELLFQATFALNGLLSFAERSRRALEGRGRRGWYVQAAMAAGLAAGMSVGGGNPSWTFRGPIIAELEAFLASLLIAPELGMRENALWMHPTLFESVRPYYREEGRRRHVLWSAPGLLLPELSRNDRGREPIAGFFERIKYGAPR